jgi:protein-disulfide isomerase
MSAEKDKKSITLRLPSGNWLMIVLAGLLIIGAFFIGSLTTQVKLLKKGATLPSQVANNNPPSVPGDPPAPRQAGEVDPVTDEDWVKGDRNARIALIEYSDLECPFCQRFHPTAQQVVDEYEGEVMWVYRHFPLTSIHSKAPKEAEATECAGELGGNDSFWAMLDKIFEVSPTNNGLDLDILPDLAEEVGLNRQAFTECLDSGKYASKVDAQLKSGTKAGVTGTPGNILLDTETGETLLLPGALPFTQMQQAIDQMLEN